MHFTFICEFSCISLPYKLRCAREQVRETMPIGKNKKWKTFAFYIFCSSGFLGSFSRWPTKNQEYWWKWIAFNFYGCRRSKIDITKRRFRLWISRGNNEMSFFDLFLGILLNGNRFLHDDLDVYFILSALLQFIPCSYQISWYELSYYLLTFINFFEWWYSNLRVFCLHNVRASMDALMGKEFSDWRLTGVVTLTRGKCYQLMISPNTSIQKFIWLKIYHHLLEEI